MSQLAQDLLRWYDSGHRSMPWRDQPGPYRTWISEAMLQQTRVDTVVPYFERFMETLPTVEDLARAPLDQVLGLWSGLGYYSRARNLHKAAALIVEAGHFPDSVEGLLRLPGVGPYMAGAIASIALGLDVPTVDGNIARVLSRVHREADTGKPIWRLASSHIPAGRAGDHNQALMDLGSHICTPRTPRCADCPIQAHCAARQVGDIEAFPPRSKRKKSPTWIFASAIVHDEDRVLLGKRPPTGMFGGLYEPPMFRVQDVEPLVALKQGLQEMGLDVVEATPHGEVRHILTHRVLQVLRFRVRGMGTPTPGAYSQACWIERSKLEEMGLSTLARKVLAGG